MRSLAAYVLMTLAAGLAAQQVFALWLGWTHDGIMYRLRLPIFSYGYRARLHALNAIERDAGPVAEVWLGDSLVERMPCDRRTPPCLALGIGGDTVFGVLHRAEQHPSLGRARRVVVHVGHNDLGKTNDLAYVAELYRRALRTLPDGPEVVCHAVLPVDERATDERSNSDITALNAQIRAACAQAPKARYADPREALIDATGNLRRELHVGDGVHLSDAGYARWLAYFAP